MALYDDGLEYTSFFKQHIKGKRFQLLRIFKIYPNIALNLLYECWVKMLLK